MDEENELIFSWFSPINITTSLLQKYSNRENKITVYLIELTGFYKKFFIPFTRSNFLPPSKRNFFKHVTSNSSFHSIIKNTKNFYRHKNIINEYIFGNYSKYKFSVNMNINEINSL